MVCYRKRYAFKCNCCTNQDLCAIVDGTFPNHYISCKESKESHTVSMATYVCWAVYTCVFLPQLANSYFWLPLLSDVQFAVNQISAGVLNSFDHSQFFFILGLHNQTNNYILHDRLNTSELIRLSRARLIKNHAILDSGHPDSLHIKIWNQNFWQPFFFSASTS